MLFISVDGGATKTISVLYNENGEIISVGVNGPSNFRNIGVETARDNVKAAIDYSLENAGIGWDQVDFFTFALAGVKDSAKSTSIIEDFISSYNLGKKYSLLNDGEMGFKCRFPDEEGIIVAPGTGMIAYGKRDNVFERASGWGWLIGDEGGAFYIGRRAIQLSAMIADGRLVTGSRILDTLMAEFGADEPRKLVNEIYTNPIDIRRIASLARIVSDLERKGDDLCKGILEEAASEAGKCANALQERLSGGHVLPVSGYGGVYRAGEVYWNKFTEKVREYSSEIVFRKPLPGYHAVLGSVHTVLEQNGKLLKIDDMNGLSIELDRKVMKLPREQLAKYLLM